MFKILSQKVFYKYYIITSQVKEAQAVNARPTAAAPYAGAAEDNSRLFAGGNAAFQDFSANAGEAAAKTAAIEEEVKKNIGEQSQANFKSA